jgi:uncharacterized membrane protein SpoIIM required for sporulation
VTLGNFVRRNRARWQRLEQMVDSIEKRGVSGAPRGFLQELTRLYRATTGDLAFAETHFAGTTVLLFLHQLVARAHNQIFRAGHLSGHAVHLFFRNEIPAAARRHLSAIVWSAIIFLLGAVLGLAAVQFDEHAASAILPTRVLDSIYSGQMWTGPIFSVIPAPVASTFLFTSNISVALLALAGGLSFGVITVAVLLQNGFMLGVVFKLCADYGMLGPLLAFVASHGFLEISAFVVAGGAGLVLAQALLRPGSISRRDALSRQGRTAARLATACVPALVTAGGIEAFVSPSGIPLGFKLTLGLVLGAVFWIYLLIGPRAVETAPQLKAAPIP